ncbi:MAG: choice-of-anchor D domain-containing protein [Luteolibacter sp.]
MKHKIRTHNLSAALLAALVASTAPVGASSITIANSNFEAIPLPDWYWVPDWDEGGASYVTTDGWSGAGRVLYLDGGGWVSQNMGYSWTAGDVFTLGIRGNQGWRSGGTFKIQLRQADGTVLWDSGTTAVESSVQNFSWTIDASTFTSGTPGGQLNIRIDCLANTVFLDDVTLSTGLADTSAPTLAGGAIVDDLDGGPVFQGELVTYTVRFSEDMDASTVSAEDFGNAGTAPIMVGTVSETVVNSGIFTVPVTATGTGSLQLQVNAGAVLKDAADNSLATSSAIPDDTTISVVPVGASITIVNGNFQAVPLPNGNEVMDWDEGGASYVASDAANYRWSAGAGRVLYLDGGGWVSQNLGYNWTAGDVFTLGMKGNQGWRTGGTFKIQLRQADGMVLWDSGTTPVTSTVSNFRWGIDASTFIGTGVTPGSQLSIRIDCLANTVFLDDVTLTTTLADTTAPTLADSALVDNKSGGPVNPGEVVTYTVTFSEAMNSGTVSSSDFDNGGTATAFIGSPTTLDGVNFQIPVVASSTGTLQLRVPVGATMTDLAGIPLDSSSAILDDTTIDVVAKAIGVTGGDFEFPYTNGQPGDVPFWFDSNYIYADWQNAAQYSANGSQTALFQYFGGYHGYMYQSLGQLAAGTKRLVWSFDQVKGNGTANLRFFYGVSPGVGQGVDIDTLSFTQIGSTVSIPGTLDNVVARSGSIDASAVPAGSTIWVDFTHAGGDEFLLDNISVSGAADGQEIAVEQPAGTDIPSGSGSRDFGTVALGSNTSLNFTVRNPGTADLYLTGMAPDHVVITGADAADFTVTAQPSTPVTSGGGTTTFTVRFAPGGEGARSAALSIANDDTTGGEAPFIINLSGTGTTGTTAYDTWATQIADTNQRARGDDPDGDGFTNGVEFLFGSSPIAGNGSLVTTTASGGNLVLRWLQRESGATYTLQQSATLEALSWTTAAQSPALDGDQTGAPTDYDCYSVSIPFGSGKLFHRIMTVEN